MYVKSPSVEDNLVNIDQILYKGLWDECTWKMYHFAIDFW